jgi:predicted RND superfamily exporter protein
LVLLLLRARDVAAIMVPMLLSSVWWAGLLPLFGIKASLTLMLPTVFLISVGSDYAIQYVWNYRQQGDMRAVYGSTGKANLFVVAATVVAFLLFVPMKLVLSSQGALAAALAILVIFTVTTILVPVFYKVALRDGKPHSPPPASREP